MLLNWGRLLGLEVFLLLNRLLLVLALELSRLLLGNSCLERLSSCESSLHSTVLLLLLLHHHLLLHHLLLHELLLHGHLHLCLHRVHVSHGVRLELGLLRLLGWLSRSRIAENISGTLSRLLLLNRLSWGLVANEIDVLGLSLGLRS